MRYVPRVIRDKAWDVHYRLGGSSGLGSAGVSRSWKWSVIDRFVSKVDDVVDLGCGDLSFWEGRECLRYVGIDSSSYVIKKDRLKRPTWSFVVSRGERLLPVSGKVVFCLDVLFHVLDDDDCGQIIDNLCAYSTEWIFVYTWYKNRLGSKKSDHLYQVFRLLDKQHFSRRGFDCIAEVPSPTEVNPYGAMFVFNRRGKDRASE
jgi:hypothetical protein